MVFDAGPPDLVCEVWDFDGVEGVVSAMGEVLPLPVALFMIRENIVAWFAAANSRNGAGEEVINVDRDVDRDVDSRSIFYSRQQDLRVTS